MREERGKIVGDIIVYEPYTLWGSVAGTVRVIDGGKFYNRGAIYGNLIVETGGRCHILGNVQHNVIVHEGAKVIHSGVIGGDAINEGGRLYVEADSTVMGTVKSRSGETRDLRKS